MDAVPAGAEPAQLVSVTDGDTIRVNVGGIEESVRLILIDTPETHDPDDPPECYGQEATAYLSWLLSLGGQLYAVGLILVHGPADDGFHFIVDPALNEWWIAYHNPDGSWTDMVLPVSYAGLTHDPIERLEVQVTTGGSRFFVNGVELTASFDMSWMQIPQTGDSGVAVANSAANPTAPVSATFDSFGMYAL